jgi:hypothetical protein
MADARDWSVTPASNTDLFPEGMAASAVNDAARTVQSAIAKLIKDAGGSTATTGSSNAYAIGIATTPASLADGLAFSFTANHTNTAAATLAVTPSGASAFTTKALRKNGVASDVALQAGDIILGNRYLVQYEASATGTAGGFIVLNPSSATDPLFITSGIVSAVTELDIAVPTTFSPVRMVIELIDCTVTSDGSSMTARVSTDNLSSLHSGASDYTYALSGWNSTSGALGTGAPANSIIVASPVSNVSGNAIQCTLTIPNPAGALNKKLIRIDSDFFASTGGTSHLDGQGAYGGTDAITHIRLAPSAGTMTTAYRVYGWR